MKILQYSLSIFFFLLLSACASTTSIRDVRLLDHKQYLPTANITLKIPSLSNCTSATDTTLRLNKDEPVIIIVHGCFSSAGLFRSLADVFAFHGQQAICFSYNDRDSLEKSADELIRATETLSHHLDQSQISVIGHSQGGLVSHRAFIKENKNSFSGEAIIDLTTISTPFGGIESSAHCGSSLLAWLSLGLTKPICQLITGSKYKEIPPNATFITQPGHLIAATRRHLKIVTDETDSCRRYNAHGSCIEDDYVFSIDEQTQESIDSDQRLLPIYIKAGHVEIVGNSMTAPEKLISILQTYRVLRNTPAHLDKEFTQLIKELYIKSIGE